MASTQLHRATQATQANEYRRIGPPGTGKTTWIVGQIERAVDAYVRRTGRLAAECGDVLVSSLTRSAAAEVRSRGIEIPPTTIRTLHSHAYHALGEPAMCVGRTELADFNAWCQPGHRVRFSSAADSREEDGEPDSNESPDFDWLHDYHCHRARLQPREQWSTGLQAFAAEYEQWKRLTGLADFSDLIERAYRDCDSAPGKPSIIFVDEAQDHDRSELRLVRKWALEADKLIVVGDPWQNLYEWRGSEPSAFFETEIPDGHQKTLDQSYRVPRAVHSIATRLLDQCLDNGPSQDYLWRPRDADGLVTHGWYHFTRGSADQLVHEVCARESAGKSVMILATCQYQLTAVCAALKRAAVPYWNPLSLARGMFNPLHPKYGTPTHIRVQAYLRPDRKHFGERARSWTWSELSSWMELVRVSQVLTRGELQTIDTHTKQDGDAKVPADRLHTLFAPGVFDRAANLNLDWLILVAKPEAAHKIEYIKAIIDARGIKGLRERPRVIVGTIHSVKGGEADCVFLSPWLSRSALLEYTEHRRDAIWRQFYVGMTRAREELILCGGRDGQSISW